MRISQFLVPSDSVLLDAGGTAVRVVLQSATGQVYVLADEVLRAVVDCPEDLDTATAAQLAEAGILVDDDADEFAEVVAENIRASRDTRKRTFVLMPSSYCNMGCGYCGQKHVKGAQSAGHRAAVISRIRHATTAAGVEQVRVSWFGGEPMLGYAQILDISAAVTATCDQAGVRFDASMTTNGSLLTVDKIRRLHQECRVGSFEITLDGVADTHDRQRPLSGGRRSFDRIVHTLASACADESMPGVRFSIRTNVSRANQEEHAAFAKAVADGGLAHPRVAFYTALVRSWGNDVSDFAIHGDDTAEVDRRWIAAYRDHGLTTALLPLARKPVVCVAVTRSAEVIDPAGKVHSCTEQPLVPGREHTALGRVTDLQTPAIRPSGAYDGWYEDLRGGSSGAYCPSCAIFPICGGGCPLVWHEGRPACPTIKTTLPARLTTYGTSLGLVRG
ncbi:radical SAM/SPASM domain-containing protein [Actinokineospora diospyrosa]|uniref:Radical SAM core domain-containing protein n=1 Tax=Actinokineospora diospyrosa TaxID=103728 RepID=A0ABT1IAY9_9PSEU|nr:radical SAM protein [Actinokineospora diospyrosa]MCP2269792.1 uncharacterized protein [Actinokineospora diospyrosa]